MKNETRKNPFPWPLLWLGLLFIVPLLTAPMLYIFRDSIPFKTVSYGHLFTPSISADSLGMHLLPESKGKWQLIYLCDASHTKECNAEYDLLKRIHLSLGKDQNRVYLSYANSENLAEPFAKPLLEEKGIHDNQILLLDPQGFLVLYYLIPIQKPKSVLEDIRRLLKYSHIG